jgi:hypothetical protein
MVTVSANDDTTVILQGADASPDTAETSQPAVVTSQPDPADIPAVGTGIHTLTLAATVSEGPEQS